jgi:chlorobactene glucosyltransferase
MLSEAERRRLTLLSCWPALELVGCWEKTLMPLLNFVVFTLYPAPLALRRPDASLGLAHGACLLAHRATYALVGGHGAVRDQLFEDVRLAQLWRERGQASLCLDGQGIVSVRMYRSFGEIWRGFQKNFFPAFRRERSFWMFIALHLSLFLLPFIFAPLVWRLTGSPVLIATALCVLVMRAVLAWRFRHPWWSVLLHPLSEAILLALGLSSWWRCRSGRGVEWKGRRYKAGAGV